MRFALGLLVMVVYVPGYTDSAIPSGWPFLSVAVALCLLIDYFRHRQIVLTQPHWFGLAFLAWCVLTLAWTTDFYGAGFALWEIGCFAAVFLWASTLDDARPVYLGLVCGLAINDVVAVAQTFGFEAVGQLSKPAGLFVSKNVFGEISALIAIALAAHRLWWFLPLCLPGLVLTGSRGALLALFAAGFLALWRWRRWAALAALLLPFAGAVATYESGHRTASLGERWIWTVDTFAALNLSGHGIGSYSAQFPSYARASDTSTRRPDHLHNDPLELAFEIGSGIILAAFFVVSCLESPLWAERLVFVGFLTLSFFEMPLHTAAESFVGAVVAGRLARCRVVVRDRIGVGGQPQRGWLSRSGYPQDRARRRIFPV